jgi:hypothetical protein
MTINKETKVNPSNGIVIKYKGVIDIDNIYKNIKSWFNSNNYDFFEKENTEKNKPQGNTLILKMVGEREVDDYVKFIVEVDIDEMLRIKKVNKGYSGEARIILRARIIIDYKDNWKAVSFLFNLYNNIILKKKFYNFYWPKIYDEMMGLNHLIKSDLGLIR